MEDYLEAQYKVNFIVKNEKFALPSDSGFFITINSEHDSGTYSVVRTGQNFVLTAADVPSFAEAVYQFCSLGSIDEFEDFSGKIDFESEKFGCKYVWGDEFTTNSLDTSKWTFGNNMSARPNLLLAETEDVLNVKGGTLNMSAIKTGKTTTIDGNIYNVYKTTRAINTKGTMNFRYGYVEMRAMMPYGDKVWPAFWTGSDCLLTEPSNVYSTEVDIAEVISSSNVVGSHIHKWDSTGRIGSSDSIAGINAMKYEFDSQSAAQEYHTYGFKWTDSSMIFYVDDIQFAEVTAEHFKNSKLDIDDFVDSMYLILNNHLYSKDTSTPTEYNGDGTKFVIDYVRLYQDASDASSIIKLKK